MTVKLNKGKFNWLFVVQNFEIKSYQDSAARIEIVEPILSSSFVNSHQLLCFDRNYQEDYAQFVQQRITQLAQDIQGEPVVIYGAGLHTEQHLAQLKALNIVALADRNSALWGTTFCGYPVVSPDTIKDHASHVVISSKAFETSILEELPTQYPQSQWYGLYPTSSNEVFFAQMAHSITEQLSKAASHSQAIDIVFFSPCHPQDSLPAHYWQKLKQQFPHIAFVTLWWDYDELAASPYLSFERECLSWADCIIENSNSTRLLAMKAKEGVYQHHEHSDKVIFHPTVFSPHLFYSAPLEKKKHLITLFGSAAGERKQWIEYLLSAFPEKFTHIGGVLHGEQTLSIEKYAENLRASRITINTQTYPFREQCKGKVREALACGVLLLEQDNQQTRQLLAHGQGVLYFKDETELGKIITQLLDNPELIQQTIENGQQVWLAEMTAEKWTAKLLQKLSLKSS